LPTSVAPECRLLHDLAGSDIPYFLNSGGQIMFPFWDVDRSERT